MKAFNQAKIKLNIIIKKKTKKNSKTFTMKNELFTNNFPKEKQKIEEEDIP
jgi:hypothetical protein